jgi:hypothetical protein
MNMAGIYDTVQNPIPQSNLWITCESIEALMERVQGSTSDPNELRMIMLGAMLALNTAHYLVETEILNQEVFI